MNSKELQIGKAGEHFVCYDLIMQGYNVFLADAGCNFDVIIEKGGLLKTIQVKSTRKIGSHAHAENAYRFSTRYGKRGVKFPSRTREPLADYYAFVALDIKVVAYLTIEQMISRNGGIKTTIDFKSRLSEKKSKSPNHIQDFQTLIF